MPPPPLENNLVAVFQRAAALYLHLELLDQLFQLGGQLRQTLGIVLHLTAALADLGRLLVDAGDVAGDIGNHHRALGYIFG
jgi:hypothetical protein